MFKGNDDNGLLCLNRISLLWQIPAWSLPASTVSLQTGGPMSHLKVDKKAGIDNKNIDGIDLERDLSDDYLSLLRKRGPTSTYQSHERLYYQGEQAETIYILLSGSVKSSCLDSLGHETLLKIHGPGSFLGLSALRPRGIRDATAITLESSRVVSFEREIFFDLMRQEGQLGVILVQLLLKRQQQLHARLSEVSGHRVDQRLARVLLQLESEANTRAPNSTKSDILITHDELATIVLSRRQYVTQILRTFVSNGLIINRRRRIELIDFDGLRKIAHGTSGILS